MARQLNSYLTSSNLLPSLQSGFRPGHSTETAVLRVLSDLLVAVDGGNFVALVLLDLSLITVFCASGCSRPSVWMGRFWHGSSLTSTATHSMFVVAC